MTDLVIRALSESDAELFDSLQDSGLVGRAAFGHRYATVLNGGEYRPEWTWVALRDGTVVARAAWWAGPDDTEPVLLNWFDFADGEDGAGAELLRRAPFHVEYELILPANWREVPAVTAAARPGSPPPRRAAWSRWSSATAISGPRTTACPSVPGG